MAPRIPTSVRKCPLCKTGPLPVMKSGKLAGHKCSHDVTCKPREPAPLPIDVPHCGKCHLARHREEMAVAS